jgi:hypothetical protein
VTGKVFSKDGGQAAVDTSSYSLPNVSLPYLTPYVKALRPAKPAPGGTMTVTLGVRNDGAADGKVRRGRGRAGAQPGVAAGVPAAAGAAWDSAWPEPDPTPLPLPPPPPNPTPPVAPQIGAIAAWNDAHFAAGSACAWKNATLLTPPFDVTVPPGKEATVSFDLPAAPDAGVWRTLTARVDANCTNPKGPSQPRAASKPYETKA